MTKYKMFVDEGGREHQSHYTKYYILLGCIIETGNQKNLEIQADLIKYRFWKDTAIVFHSQQLPENEGIYTIFNDKPELKDEFMKDILDLIRHAPIRVSCAIVDKAAAYKIGWKANTLVNRTADSILRDFLNFIYLHKGQGNSGAIIYEASGYKKDAQYLKAFTKVLTPGFEHNNTEFYDIRDHLTSVSFATKLNKDIECELADILSYAVYMKYKVDSKLITLNANSYESKLIKQLEAKLLSPHDSIAKNKADYLKNTKGFNVLPRPTTKNSPQKKRTA